MGSQNGFVIPNYKLKFIFNTKEKGHYVAEI